MDPIKILKVHVSRRSERMCAKLMPSRVNCGFHKAVNCSACYDPAADPVMKDIYRWCSGDCFFEIVSSVDDYGCRAKKQ